ncbi:MAG: hypothetical protein ABEJ36_05865 [Candidatus Nanosalina sp.]
MEAVDNAADRKEMRKILNLLGFKSVESGEPEPIRVDDLDGSVGEDVSNELVQLQGKGAVKIDEDGNGQYAVLTDAAYDQLETEGLPLNSLGEVETEDMMEETEDLNPEDMPDWVLEIEEPERYVAALAPFGDALDKNADVRYSETHVLNYVGRDLSEELKDLADWDYLERFTPEELGLEGRNDIFYQLNTDDRDVQADAAFSSEHLEEHYHGNVPTFLDEHSEKDEEILRKKGVKFYQEF